MIVFPRAVSGAMTMNVTRCAGAPRGCNRWTEHKHTNINGCMVRDPSEADENALQTSNQFQWSEIL